MMNAGRMRDGMGQGLLIAAGMLLLGVLAGSAIAADAKESKVSEEKIPDTTNIDFTHTLKKMRFDLYYHPKVDIIGQGYRPVGGRLADFAVGHHAGRYHFFYIERRLQEGTPFFPGHEIFFGHASTANFFDWEVHDPVMLIRPGTWEGGHVFAPCIIEQGGEYVMAYTGLNRELSQNIGLASSKDMFEWKRWDSNPISPLADADWAGWWPDDIAGCRDPHLFRHEGRIYMILTANTKEGATCIALFSTTDLKKWKDHGPILVGAAKGYEVNLWGGHPQGSLESANLSLRNGKWRMIVNCSIRNKGRGVWIGESDRMDHFDFDALRPFWPGAGCIENVRDRGSQTLLAGIAADGRLKFGVVDWSDPEPTAHFVTADELRSWQEE